MGAPDDAELPALIAAAHPSLTAEQRRRLASYGTARAVQTGDVVFAAGDRLPDLVLIESGAIDFVRAASPHAPEELLYRFEADDFVGELNLLTGERVFFDARVVEGGTVVSIDQAAFRRLMAEEPDLSDLLLRAFIARRTKLQRGPGALGIEIIGSAHSSRALALRTFAARQQLAHSWLDYDSVEGGALLRAAGLRLADLPAVVLPDAVLTNATPGILSEHLGLSVPRDSDEAPVDLAVIGAGPAGLAAAMYGASEGLQTVLLEAVGTGGQAAASSRIENYLGFPSGLSGAELTGRAMVQAEKFGARLYSPCRVDRLETGADGLGLRLTLDDGAVVRARSVIIASGAHYRSLPLPEWSRFEGNGIYYAATELEARACGTDPVTVIGGANSSGQAALYLADRGAAVTIAVRRDDLSSTMSAYLVDRLRAHRRVTIRTSTEVTGLIGAFDAGGAGAGASPLAEVTVTDRATGASESIACRGLFCFIGAEPATSWLRRESDAGGVDGTAAASPGTEGASAEGTAAEGAVAAGTGVLVRTDREGFVLTDVALGTTPDEHPEAYRLLGRAPLPFETSVPAVFAAGDVRLGSMKRVAAAVGEGASAVRSVHQAIAPRA
ncbi:MAG: FAD-dependent oxidoreductase [Herbiconiux sp.]|nr:FAD-dependent oxidoreductase [Herbiconiux sp.]